MVVHYSAVHRVKIVVTAMEGGIKSEAQHAGGIKFTCVLRERISVRPGDHVRLGVRNAHLHLFHGDSGEQLEPAH